MANGRLLARLAYRDGYTRLVDHQQNAPLKIARTFESEEMPGGLEICVMDCSPGLLAGDTAQLEWIVESGAKLRVTTQGATRVHPSQPPFDETTQQIVRLKIEEGARLVYFPETIIPFRDARFGSNMEAQVENGGQLILFEALSAGRIARGEVFAFESVKMRLHVRDERRPLFVSQNRFQPALFSPQNPFGWGEFTQWATLLAFGPGVDDQWVQTALNALSQSAVVGSASLLDCDGIVVTMLARRAHDARIGALQIAAQWQRLWDTA